MRRGSWPAGHSIIGRLVRQQLDHSLHVVLLGIELVQRGGQLQAQFGGVESHCDRRATILTPSHFCPAYTLALGVKLTGTKRTPGIFLSFKYFASCVALDPGRAEQLKRSVGAPANRNIGAFDHAHAGIERCFGQAAQVGRRIDPGQRRSNRTSRRASILPWELPSAAH